MKKCAMKAAKIVPEASVAQAKHTPIVKLKTK